MKRRDVDVEDDQCEAERLGEIEEVEHMKVADGDNIEERLELIEDVDRMQVVDVDYMQVVDVHCEDEGLKDIDDLECMRIVDGDCVHILDVRLQLEKDECPVKDLELEHVNQDDQADAVLGCKKVLEQMHLDVQEVMEVPSLLKVVA